jgi:hypothetical protein
MDRIGASLRAFAVPLFLPTFGSQSESVLTDVNLWWSACSGQAATTELFDISGDADEKEQICPKLHLLQLSHAACPGISNICSQSETPTHPTLVFFRAVPQSSSCLP